MTDYLVNLNTPDLGGVFYTMYNWADSGEAVRFGKRVRIRQERQRMVS